MTQLAKRYILIYGDWCIRVWIALNYIRPSPIKNHFSMWPRIIGTSAPLCHIICWVKRKVSQLKGGALNRLSVAASIERGAGLLATRPAADTTTSQPVTGQWVSESATCGVSETLASFTTGSMGICLDTGTVTHHRVMTVAFIITSSCEITIRNG